MSQPEVQMGPNFIRNIIDEDLANGKHQTVITRFPPEPNGYLHIGHAKSICLNFGLASYYSGRCHLRFDDTNPVKEEQEYIDAIKEDVRWLGFEWGEYEYHASDYFETLYAYAEKLVEKDLAFVCDLTPDEMREYRGTLTEPGKQSPFRGRSVEENLDLLRRMRAGEFADGSRVLRAKIDMASPNLNLRDPIIYRILRAHSSAYRRRLVHLPDVRFRPRPVGFDRRDNSFPLHSRVSGSSSPVRLVLRGIGDLPSAADRVRQAQPDIHGDEQAPSAGTGQRETCVRLG